MNISDAIRAEAEKEIAAEDELRREARIVSKQADLLEQEAANLKTEASKLRGNTTPPKPEPSPAPKVEEKPKSTPAAEERTQELKTVEKTDKTKRYTVSDTPAGVVVAVIVGLIFIGWLWNPAVTETNWTWAFPGLVWSLLRVVFAACVVGVAAWAAGALTDRLISWAPTWWRNRRSS